MYTIFITQFQKTEMGELPAGELFGIYHKPTTMDQLTPFGFYEGISPIIDIGSQSAYNWGRGYPQSCVCQESYVSASSCQIFKCPCTCDVTAGACDFGCCCDPDCTSEQIARFSSIDACIDVDTSPDEVQLCYTTSQLHKVNPRDPMGGQATAQGAVGDALCVYKKNYARKSFYYVEDETEDSSVFSSPSGQKEYNYIDLAIATSSSSVQRIDAVYDQGDAIPALQRIVSDAVTYEPYLGLGQLSVPRKDFSGQCNDNNFAQFEVKQPKQFCERIFAIDADGFRASCVDQSVGRYVSNLFVGPNADSTTSSSFISVTLGSLYYEDPLDGNLTDIASLWVAEDCSTQYLSGASFSSLMNNSNCVFATENTLTQLVTNASETFDACNNVVRSVEYQVYHSSTGNNPITKVIANVVVSDVLAQFSDITPTIVYMQQFGVDYVGENGSDPTQSAGNQVYRHRSGNPGYLAGSPVLFGSLDTTDSVIDESESGLTILSPVAASVTGAFGDVSACPSASNVNLASRLQLRFGYDVTSGCILKLTRQEFEEYCNGLSSLTTSSVPYFFQDSLSTSGYIGSYGNADPLDADQWIPLDSQTLSTLPSFDESSLTCNNMLTGLHYQFLVANGGEKSNPQNKIVSALMSYTFTDEVFRLPNNNTLTEQALYLTTTVTFVYKSDSSMRGYNPPPPPVLFKVPWDAFYPFFGAGNSQINKDAVPFIGILSTLLVSVLLCFLN